MPNPYVNKVVFGNDTLIDLTGISVNPSVLLENETAIDASGALITGEATVKAIVIHDTLDSAGGTIRSISGVSLENDTVAADKLLYGITAHDSDGDLVTGSIPVNDSTDVTVSGNTITVGAGYYGSSVSKSVASGSATAPATISDTGASITVGSNTLTFSKVISVTPTVSEGYVTAGTAGNSTVSLTASVNTRSSSDLSASGATVTAPAGYYANAASTSVASGSATAPATISNSGATVTVGTNTLTLSKTVSVTPNVSAGYVSSGTAGNSSVSLTANVNTNDSTDLVVSGNTVTAPSGYYENNASASVANGTEGTPVATKGTVNNHSISITPSVTNTAGYIAGGSHTGTPVSVTASELVSGSDTVTVNDTYDVTNLASLIVNVPTGGGSDTILTGTVEPSGTGQTSMSITNVPKTPKWFAIVLGNNPSSSTNRRITAIMYDGTNTYGGCYRQAGSGSSKTALYTYNANYSWSYSGTTLTLTSPGSSTGGYFDSTSGTGYYYMIGQ